MYDLWEEMARMQQEMDRMFDGFFDRRPLLTGPKGKEGAVDKARSPVCNVTETKDSVVATFEIPGVDKKDIELNVLDNIIEVRAERKMDKEVKDEKKGYYSYMSHASQFYRALPLPKKVTPDSAVAVYKDGVLKVTMPKAEPEKKRIGHRVDIS